MTKDRFGSRLFFLCLILINFHYLCRCHSVDDLTKQRYDSLVSEVLALYKWNPTSNYTIDTLISQFRRDIINVDDFGAKGDGIHDDSKAFKKAWEKACYSTDSLTFLVPPGKTYLLNPIKFGGPCTSYLIIQVSGTIIAPDDPEIWDENKFKGKEWIRFKKVDNLQIEGGGTINGRGDKWWNQSCKIDNHVGKHPQYVHYQQLQLTLLFAIIFDLMENLNVKNLNVKRSQQMHIEFRTCANVVADNLTILGPAYSPNTDGIHVSASKDVIISNSIIRTGDDCVSIASESFHILVENITCGPGHGISVGSLGEKNSEARVSDVMVNRAHLENCKNGLRIKTWQGGTGFATRITFQNVYVDNVEHPLVIDQYYCDSRKPCKNETSAVKVSDVKYLGVRGTSATKEVMRFACSRKFPCENIVLSDIHLAVSSGSTPITFCENAIGYIIGTVIPKSCLQSLVDIESTSIIKEIGGFQLQDVNNFLK